MTYERARKVAIARDTVLAMIIGLLSALALRADFSGMAEYTMLWIIAFVCTDIALIGLDPFIRHNVSRHEEQPKRTELKIYNMKRGGEREC